jgi:hypothetical protein
VITDSWEPLVFILQLFAFQYIPLIFCLHSISHLGGRAQLPDTILEEDHPMTIPSKFGFNRATGSRQDGFYVNFP